MITKELLLKTNEFVDNEYLTKYVNLINDNVMRKHEPFVTNKHHIIPRYIFKKRREKLDNSKENTVHLMYKDHLLAHFYLSGCAIGQGKYWNLYAVFQLSGKKYFDNNLVKEIENLDDYQKIYTEAVTSAPNHRKGSKVSDETKERMKKAQKIRCETIGPTNKGTVWVNNSFEERMINKTELDKYIKDGFVKGRIYKHSDKTKAKIAESSRHIYRGPEFSEKMRQYALKQGPRSAETRKKLSDSVSEYYKTHNSPMLGKKQAKESIEKMRSKLAGRKRVNNGEIFKQVYPEEVQKYLDMGWKLGGLKKKK